MDKKDLGKMSIGMEPNVAGCLCYVLGFVSGIVFVVIEKENKFVRFHAMQSIITFGALFVAGLVFTAIPVLGWLLVPILGLAELALWIILMIKAYQGETFKLPVAGDLAEKYI